MCILYTIQQKEMYGYDIIQKMSRYFHDVDESTFYAILRRLHKEGLTEVYYGEESNGPKRKYYKIVDKGRLKLEQSIKEWKNIISVVEAMGI